MRGLGIFFRIGAGEVQATRDVSFQLKAGERLGIVGESGCGKTVTGLSILGLLPRAQSRVVGEVRFEGRDLLTISPRQMRQVRGRQISMIFQEPMSALDPVFTVGEQIAETLRAHRGWARRKRASAPSTRWRRSASRCRAPASTNIRTSSRAACASV